jgi:hypothetical protein
VNEKNRSKKEEGRNKEEAATTAPKDKRWLLSAALGLLRQKLLRDHRNEDHQHG